MLKQTFSVVMLAAMSAFAMAHAQDTILTPGADEYQGAFDKSDELKITGQIEKVEPAGADTILWVRAKTVEQTGFGVRPGTDAKGAGMLWRIEGHGASKVKDPAKLVIGAKVALSGYNAADKACKPTCRLSAEKVTVK